MYGILVSALYTALGWVFRAVLMKAMVYGVLFYITTEFMQYLQSKLANSALGSLQPAVNGIDGSILWALNVFRLDVGLPMVLAAAGLRFAIRRIPVIG